MLSSLKLDDSVGSLLVQNSVAAFSATDHVPLLQRIFCPAVTADVRHAGGPVCACVHGVASARR